MLRAKLRFPSIFNGLIKYLMFNQGFIVFPKLGLVVVSTPLGLTTTIERRIHVQSAANFKEDCKLVEGVFDYIPEMDSVRPFRKPEY